MDSGLSPPEALTSSSDDYEYLAELTRQMAYHTLLEQDDENDKKPDSVPDVRTSKGYETQRWVDLFAVSSPQSTLWSPSRLTRYRTMESSAAEKSTSESSSAEEDLSWDTPQAYEPRIEETSDTIESAQKKSCCDQDRGNHDRKLSRDSYFPPERAPKQTNPAKRRTRSGLIHGECYVCLSLPQQQKCYPLHVAGFGTRAFSLDSRTGSTGTGVFLPRTARNPSDRARRKPRSSTVLIPARVAQALLVHFSKMNPQGGSFSLQPGASGRCGVGPFLQKGQPEEPCRPGLTDTWHFHPLPNKVEEKNVKRRQHMLPVKQMSSVVSNKEEIIGNELAAHRREVGVRLENITCLCLPEHPATEYDKPGRMPPTVARNTPLLNDMTASIAMYAKPTPHGVHQLRQPRHDISVRSGLQQLAVRQTLHYEAHNEDKRQGVRVYILVLVLGHLVNRTSALFPQKKVVCIIILLCMCMGPDMVEGGGAVVPPASIPQTLWGRSSPSMAHKVSGREGGVFCREMQDWGFRRLFLFLV